MKLHVPEIAIAAVLLALDYQTASAVEPFAATPQETALCSALIYGGKDKAHMGRIEPGVGWGHTHHWCDCVRFRFRAIKSLGNKDAFRFNLQEAIGGCDYVISHAPHGSRLLPKVHVDKGRALKLRGDTGAAAQEFQLAISLDPAEVNAYSELSLLQEERSQQIAARETVALGLRNNPDSKLLQKRYLELGGKEPFPEPIARSTPALAPAPVLPEKPIEQPSSEVIDLEPAEPVIAVEALQDSPEVDSQPAPDGRAAAEGVGRSCRFCPPEEIQRRWIDSFKTNQQKQPE